MAPFDPPDYIVKLIASLNDAARSAYVGTTWFLGVGLYLAAISISITDEEILLGHSTSIAQLSVSVPLLVNFGIAPLVFVVLHIMTLFRYYALMVQLRDFHGELAARVDNEQDRQRCLGLLVNVEFVVPGPSSERLSLRNMARAAFFYGFVAVFPTLVLLLIQVSSLRIQNANLNRLQDGMFWVDLVVLVAFLIMHRRQTETESWKPWRAIRRAPFVMLLFLMIPVVAHIRWLHVVRPGETTVLEREDSDDIGFLRAVWLQPLDLLLCPQPPSTYEYRSASGGSRINRSGWNLPFLCRFVTMTNRPLVNPVWLGGAIADLRDENYYPAGDPKSLGSVQGASLVGRILRFANLDQVELFRANLAHADLRHAILSQANLLGASLWRAKLDDADLYGARLQGVYLAGATAQRSDLRDSRMQGASFEQASLQHARLNGANLTCANLEGVSLQHADLTGADMTCARLKGADLTGAILTGATWAGVEMKDVIGYDRAAVTVPPLPAGMVCHPSDAGRSAAATTGGGSQRAICR